MSVGNLLGELRLQGVEIFAEKDILRLRAPLGVLTTELRDKLIGQKAEIIEILRNESASPHPNDAIKQGKFKIIQQSESMTWYTDESGKNWRYFSDLARSFLIELIRPGDPATCISCGRQYQWLAFPAFAGRCGSCQPSTSVSIPDPGEPRFENGLEFCSGPYCRACGAREDWRRNEHGSWVCRLCHPEG
jgi:hypothetical protein